MKNQNLEEQLVSQVIDYVDYIQRIFQKDQTQNRGDFDSEPSEDKQLIEKEIEKAAQNAKEEIESKVDARKRICAALSKISGDVFEIAKTITPVVITLSVPKIISTPSEGLILAYTVIALARMGTAALCVEYKE